MNCIGIIGLGLIGGSMAKSIAEHTDHKVYGYDASNAVVERAIKESVLAGRLDEHYADIDMLFVVLYPLDVVDIILDTAGKLKKGCIVIDCTGVKGIICKGLSQQLSDMGLRFIGGHPMAGKEVAGYENASPELFSGASMILCTDEHTDKEALDTACELFPKLGFSQVKITTYEEHDRVIAYTSQLAHIVSSAYIKSPTLDKRYGFSAGSFKDLTRVAKLNEEMWADLFLANEGAILAEIDEITGHLNEYRDAIGAKDRDRLVALLADGRIRKEADERKDRS
ncbi:MAG: prephenate dehydrogenase/arogenate dehydrogenase family protein [Lachnospiraceae bacterium]|nr:prephenate dehydrogenase/arogenate dehydrogenase family protein [Lachnospiraceae bacterium]